MPGQCYFESLAVIGWFSKDLDPVSLIMDKERGLAEDFCKLWMYIYCLNFLSHTDTMLLS